MTSCTCTPGGRLAPVFSMVSQFSLSLPQALSSHNWHLLAGISTRPHQTIPFNNSHFKIFRNRWAYGSKDSYGTNRFKSPVRLTKSKWFQPKCSQRATLGSIASPLQILRYTGCGRANHFCRAWGIFVPKLEFCLQWEQVLSQVATAALSLPVGALAWWLS